MKCCEKHTVMEMLTTFWKHNNTKMTIPLWCIIWRKIKHTSETVTRALKRDYFLKVHMTSCDHQYGRSLYAEY